VYTDFSKAFDKVRHCLLLDKMSANILSARCLWLGSYFSGSTVCVSGDILVTSDVPQKSHLELLYFIWFVNELAMKQMT
jgi:hypothetical protein